MAVVTGVSRRRGIGFAVAGRLAQLGADLCLHSFAAYDARQPWGADAGGPAGLARELERHGGRVLHLDLDLRDPAAPGELLATAAQAFGRADVLVANHTHSAMGGLEELNSDDIDQHLLVNVRATLLLVKELAARHDGRPGGRVVLLTSGQHLAPMPGELAYAASKGALHQLTLSLAAHLAPRGITVNAVNPGATDTGYASAALYQEVLDKQPAGRWGRPEDAARLIGWLATDEARWITGQVINSTGGGP